MYQHIVCGLHTSWENDGWRVTVVPMTAKLIVLLAGDDRFPFSIYKKISTCYCRCRWVDDTPNFRYHQLDVKYGPLTLTENS